MTQTDEERRARDMAYAARPEVKERRNAAKRQRIAENRWRADPEYLRDGSATKALGRG